MKKYQYKGEEYTSLLALRRAHNLSFSGAATTEFLAGLGIETEEIEHKAIPVQIDKIREQKLEELNRQCDELLEQKLWSYPLHERSTFDQQLNEAKAVLAGEKADETYLIFALAKARETSIEEFAKRVLEKHKEYIDYAGIIIGKKQQIKDALVNAKTLKAIQMLDIDL